MLMLFPDYSVLSNYLLEALVLAFVAWYTGLYAFAAHRRAALTAQTLQNLPDELKEALRLQQSIRDEVLTHNDLARAKKELGSKAKRERDQAMLNRQRAVLSSE